MVFGEAICAHFRASDRASCPYCGGKWFGSSGLGLELPLGFWGFNPQHLTCPSFLDSAVFECRHQTFFLLLRCFRRPPP
jgi:hypothetical protein